MATLNDKYFFLKYQSEPQQHKNSKTNIKIISEIDSKFGPLSPQPNMLTSKPLR